MLSPATQQVLAGILVQRVGFGGGKGVDHDRAYVAMVALKASDPESYRKLFSPLVDAAKQGPQAIKDHVQKALKNIAAGDAVAAGAGFVAQGIVTKLTSGISASGGAAGVAIGLVVGVAWGASSGRGMEAVTNAAAAFATGGLAAAISTTVATAGVAGMGIGLAIGAAPAALVALWSAYCERGVSQQQTNESVRQMTQNESIRP
ncbi:hypothetical protein L6R29_06365 [Myxococcota bacterium]|nr:hypothetical protein [Myxococcota bacterium]